MTKELQESTVIQEIEGVNQICRALMQTPHYKKIGPEGIYAIVSKAKSIGVSPMDALNGGMYFVQGKVELTSSMMNDLIRRHRHSITKDKKSDDKICILHGKRADNGDTWSESFSIDDAKLAGIYRNQWLKYPKDMLFARALSRLARQLFPDVIKGCYVQGELEEVPYSNYETISEEEAHELERLLPPGSTVREHIMGYISQKPWNATSIREMPREVYEKALSAAQREASNEAD